MMLDTLIDKWGIVIIFVGSFIAGMFTGVLGMFASILTEGFFKG